MRFKSPSKWSTFNKGIRSGKSFNTIGLTIYLVGVAKIVNQFFYIIVHVSLKYRLKMAQILRNDRPLCAL